MRICKFRSMSHKKGLTMIEVLIALLLLSFGLASLATMQLSSLQYVHSAYYRSLASTIALDFEERLWLELADNDLTLCPGIGTEDGSTPANLIADWSRTAVGDSWEWSTADLIKIPNLSVSLGTAVTTSTCTEIPVTLTWNELRFNEVESTSEQFSYTVRILCRQASSGGESAS